MDALSRKCYVLKTSHDATQVRRVSLSVKSQDQEQSKPPFCTEKKERIDSSGNVLKLPQTFSQRKQFSGYLSVSGVGCLVTVLPNSSMHILHISTRKSIYNCTQNRKQSSFSNCGCQLASTGLVFFLKHRLSFQPQQLPPTSSKNKCLMLGKDHCGDITDERKKVGGQSG